LGERRYVEYAKDIHSSGMHLLSVINEVLDMAKIEAGKLELAITKFAVTRIIDDVLRMLREQAGKRNIEIIVTLLEKEIKIFGDERAVKQAIINILSNAIKFSHDNGEIEIRLRCDAQSGLALEIEDHGIGMSEEALKRAMQPFEQADSSTTRAYGGTGLGLPIANGLVQAHGGTLKVESREGQGTKVSIQLPLRPTRRRPEPAAHAPRSIEPVT